MSTNFQQVRAIFLATLEKPRDEWDAHLSEHCAEDSSLRDQVELLLNAHVDGSGILDRAVRPDSPTIDQPVTEKPGTIIGRYKLLEQIGEGGFGVVFMAEQEEPVRRKVALKVIKAGMDTKEVIARFEAERQALAIMDHPNIARVLDAGATKSGRPYFVMELVRGVPITEYCDRNNLSARERLELFHSVCQAVQHAHQKGIIHRDIKPSNVLVTLHDDKPVAKVIDFGVAKATNARLTERTLFTRFAQMVGTPLYMSPEQAQMSGLDVDTRSDIYSLGVLLYELLTGTTPFDQQRICDAAYDELLRIIREEEPPRPSTRVSTLGEAAATSSAHRRTDPRRLSQTLRGELDWIVMKALEKDRTRRYETANAFAADVQHYLNDEAVVACPPSAAYRFRKFARRNRSVLGATATALLVLVVVAIGSSIAAGRFRSLAQRNAELLTAATEAQEQERLLRMEAEEQTRIAGEALADAQQQRDRAAANFVLARSAVDEFLNRVTEEELLEDPGLHELRQELLESAVEFYDGFTRDEANASELLVELAGAHYRIGLIRNLLEGHGAGMPSFQKSIELFEQLYESGDDSLDVRLGLAKAYLGADRDQDGAELCEAILASNPQHPETRCLLGGAFHDLATWVHDGETRSFSETTVADFEHGLTYYQKAVRTREGLVRDFPDNPQYLADLGNTLGNLGFMLQIQGDTYGAIELWQRAVSCTAQAYSRSPQWGAGLDIDLWNLALAQSHVGDHDAALESLERLVELRRRLVFDNPRIPDYKARLYKAWIALAEQQRHLNQTDEADRSFQAAQEVLENMPRKEAYELFDLAVVYAALAAGAEQDEQQQFADQAMQSLAAAIDDGYRDVRAIESHRSLAVLRDRSDFQQLVTRVKQDTETLQQEEKLGDGRQSLELIRELIGNDPDAAQHQVALATALHSIAMVQMQIGQFDHAEQSLNEALELHRKRLHDGETDRFRRFDAIKTQLSLGQLYRMLERWPEAHRVWQECLAALQELAEETRNDTEFQLQIGLLEITISNDYGSLGLWHEAAEHARRSVQFDRVDDREIVWECRLSSLLPGRVPDDRLQEYIERLVQHVPGNLDPAPRVDPRQHLVWMVCFVAPDTLPPDRFLELMQPRANAGLVRFWDQLTMALAQHRAGQHAAALDTLENTNADWTTLEKASTLSAAYLQALATHATGDADRAQTQLRQAEDLYQDFCRRTLTLTQSELAVPYTALWWELPAAQALRREALATITETSTADPWQHLIQARGYRMIGETDKADSELAAALTAAPNDPLLWLAHLELLDQWGEIARAEWEQVDWERVIELAGDDPAAWMYRGRLHAEQGQFDSAAADFDHALSVIPNRDVFKPHPPRRRVYWTAMQWDKAYHRLAQMRTDDPDLPCEHGLYLAARGEFDSALAAFRQGDPASGTVRRQAHSAMLLLLNGRRDEYLELCRALEDGYREQGLADNRRYFSAIIGTLGPGSTISPETLRDWSDRLWRDGDPLSNNAVRAAGACRFRAGDFDDALELLEHAHQLNRHSALPEYDDLNCFLLAMVHHQLGNSAESRQWYERGVAALTRWRDTPNPSTQLIPYLWLQLNVQYREATTLLGISPGEEPFQIARETEPEPDK